MEEEELLVLRGCGGSALPSPALKERAHLADTPVVALGRLLKELLVLGHLLGVGERNSVDALQAVVVLVAEEVGGRVLRRADESVNARRRLRSILD